MVGFLARNVTALMVGSAHPYNYCRTFENTQFPTVCSIVSNLLGVYLAIDSILDSLYNSWDLRKNRNR